MASSLRTGFCRTALFSAACSLVAVSASSLAAAKDDSPELITYGFDGFWKGAQIGLAAGFIATGSEFESREWRKLVFGAGVGALAGVGAGITLAAIDLGEQPPRPGWVVLRDAGYGVGLGGLVGAAVGALFLIDSGKPKNVLTGAAWGTLAGALLGVGFGVLENASNEKSRAREAGPTAGLKLHFTLAGAEGSLLPLPALGGSF